MQPYDTAVGAGTFHPATFLRAIGPEPWCAAYVQPSRRPQDGRSGKNPNRLQRYYQFQVVMKPSPDNFQDLYLRSLKELGVNAADHDIRFVEDDWESPTLGAWGLGWEIWLNGMEVSQFTYFQEVGGMAARPVTGEITYGLERLAMFLQKCDNVFDLQWTDEKYLSWANHLSYGDIYKQNEEEQSDDNFAIGDSDKLRKQFDDVEDDAIRLLSFQEEKLRPLPAYDTVMICSHLFNLLDATGEISVSERAGYINRLRRLARQCAQVYYKSREKRGFPLCPKATA